jgi:putative flippase GtrA
MDNKIKKEMGRFLVAGFSAVGTDLAIYYLLLNFLDHSSAKAISFLSGTIVAFIINKYWTFEKKKKSLKEAASFLLLYLSTLVINVTVNKLSLSILPGWVFFAFLAATGTSTVLNFIGQKWWVFKR